MGSKVAAVATLVVIGVIIADVLIHPVGAATAFQGANTLASNTYGALLGGGR